VSIAAINFKLIQLTISCSRKKTCAVKKAEMTLSYIMTFAPNNIQSKFAKKMLSSTFAIALRIARISDMILWWAASTDRMLFTSPFRLSYIHNESLDSRTKTTTIC